MTSTDVDAGLDRVPGRDSAHLLSLLALPEHTTGCALPLAEALEADGLAEIHMPAVDVTRRAGRAPQRNP